MTKRITQHILFWGIYYLICLYNELYLSKSFSLHPTFGLFLQSALAVFLTFVVKLIVVYFILYKLLPLWLKEKKTSQLFIFGFICVITGALALRLMTQLIIWPKIYHETSTSLRFSALVARFFYSLLDLLQITGAAVCIKLYKLQVESIQKQKNLVLEKSRAEILHLKSQTNPHFLFNTLNSIFSLSRSGSEQTPDAIMRLSKILRYTLYDSDKKTISISDELKIIKDYIELQQLRFSKRIEIKMETSIDSENSQLAPLLLLPLIENAYKHCSENNAAIFFSLKLTNDRLVLITSNPVSATAVISTGTGLQNIRRQLELLYKEFTLNYEIKNREFNLELMINLNSYAGAELFDIGR